MLFWSQIVSPRDSKIAKNHKKSCSRGLPESALQKVTKKYAFWVPSRPQNIGFRMRGVSKIKKSPVPKHDLKLTSKCLPFWMLLAPYLTTSAFQKGTRKCTKKWTQKVSKKEPKRDYPFAAETSPKSQKSEPSATTAPQASMRVSQAPKILKNHQSWAPKSLKIMRIW